MRTYAWCTGLCIFYASSTLGNFSSQTMKLQKMIFLVFKCPSLAMNFLLLKSLLLILTVLFKVHYYYTLACQRGWRLAIMSSSQYLSFINHAVFSSLSWTNGTSENDKTMWMKKMMKRSSLRQEVHTYKNWVKDKEMLPSSLMATHAIVY